MKTRIDLLGTSFILHSDETSEYIQRLCRLIDTRARGIQNDIDCSDPLKLSIMVSLLLSHELLEEKQHSAQLNVDTTSSASKLISMLDQAMDKEE